jgi:hypothetical protein
MNLTSARSLTAWLWDQHPEIIYALVAHMPRTLGQCFSCNLDLLSSSSAATDISASGTCFGISDPGVSLDPVSLDPSVFNMPNLSCSGLDSIGTDPTSGIPTLTQSDLTPVGTCAVTAGCNIQISCGGGGGAPPTSVTSTDAATGNALSGVAGFLTSSAGLTALARATAAYFNASAASSQQAAYQAALQSSIVNAQVARATVGKSALPVQYVANGATGAVSPMISTHGGLLPLTGSSLAALTPASLEVFLAQYGTWILIGGAAAFLAYAATRRKST